MLNDLDFDRKIAAFVLVQGWGKIKLRQIKGDKSILD